MSTGLPPRAVVITRPTELEMLLLHHGTREQARFFLGTRGQAMDPLDQRHRHQHEALHAVLAAIPSTWRRARVSRAELDRFLFEPEDVVIAVGQDGLVANVARFLRGQPVIGINPSPEVHDGVLVRHAPARAGRLLADAARGAPCDERTMVEAVMPDGQRLVALNEVFVGHRAHQSARYRLRVGTEEERQSSSGLIVCTGSGASGWARSIALRRHECPPLPEPSSPDVVLLVREPWPSVSTGARVAHARLAPGEEVTVTSEMNDGGVVFGDGMEDDRLEFPWGQQVNVRAAPTRLRLVA